MVEESARKLLQIASPPLRYYLLTDLMGKAEHEPIVQRTLEECRTYPPKLKLLGTMREDGTWPIPKQRRIEEGKGPGPPYGWTYITMLRNLYHLGEHRAVRSDGFIEWSLEKILSWQAPEGYIRGPWGPGFPLPHYNGFALRTLILFGMERDPRVQKLIHWLFSIQRPDGGWIIPYVEDMKYLPQYKSLRQEDFYILLREGKLPSYYPEDHYQVPSCIWTTMMVVRGFCQSYKIPEKAEVRRGAVFFLDRFFQKNLHSMFYQSADHWTRLRHPTYFGSGLLGLDLLTWLGYGAKEPRLDRPIKWITGARGQDELWHESGRPHPEHDQWISETGLSILNRYSESLRGRPFGWKAELLKRAGKS